MTFQTGAPSRRAEYFCQFIKVTAETTQPAELSAGCIRTTSASGVPESAGVGIEPR